MDEARIEDACAILGYGLVQASLEEIARLRRDPGPGRPKALEFQILKHADEHTVLALAAMLKGLAGFPAGAHFGDWGIVAAPRWPGRLGTVNAIDRYRADGARGVSAMAIPNLCLHSLSGTVSLVFAMRGPNFGVGGGRASVADGLLTGLGVQLEYQLPGTWVILSEWEAEPGQVYALAPPRARALALALGPVEQAPRAPRLCLRASSSVPPRELCCARLAGLTDYLLDVSSAKTSWSCTLDWGMQLVLTEGESKA